MPRVKEIRRRYDWRPIHGCPCRFVLAGGPSEITPETLAGVSISAELDPATDNGDPVIVVALEDGGIISYRKKDGRYIHTLCNRLGFRHKLRSL